MKNLANCKPSEFISQTVKIKKAAQEWMDATDIIRILRKPIQYKAIRESATPEERAEIIKENAKIQQDRGMENMSEIFDAAFERNPEKTLEILALCCFVDPKDADSHSVDEYLEAFYELSTNKAVVNFFTLLARSVQKNTSTVSRG